MIWANQHQLLNQVTLSSFTQLSIYSHQLRVINIYFHHGKLKDSIQKAILKHEYNSLQLIQHKFKESSHQWGHGKKRLIQHSLYDE